MRDLPPFPGQLGVFTSAQAHAHGWTRHQLRSALQTGRIKALRRGVYIERLRYEGVGPDGRTRVCAVAACLAHPGSVVSHHSAALLHGLSFLGSRPAMPAVTLAPPYSRRAGRDRGLIVHAAALPPADVVARGTWSIASVSRTVCDVARDATGDGVFVTALVAVDDALHRGLTTLEHLRPVVDTCRWWPGGGRLPELIELADGRSESPYESLARWKLVSLGHRSTPQVWAYDSSGPIGAGDLWLESLWTYLEVDGDVKYGDGAPITTLVEEKYRQERLERAGFGVARIAARDVRNVRVLEERLASASRRGEIERRASVTAGLGMVGPPPNWARRGAVVPWVRAPTQPLRLESR